MLLIQTNSLQEDFATVQVMHCAFAADPCEFFVVFQLPVILMIAFVTTPQITMGTYWLSRKNSDSV